MPLDNQLIAAWWDATRRRQLLIQSCADCGSAQYYPRTICRHCHRDRLVFEAASGDGIIETYTRVERAAFPDTEVPYVVARVRLDEGPVMLTNIVGFQDAGFSCDTPVRLRWRELPDGRNLPVFGPASGGGEPV